MGDTKVMPGTAGAQELAAASPGESATTAAVAPPAAISLLRPRIETTPFLSGPALNCSDHARAGRCDESVKPAKVFARRGQPPDDACCAQARASSLRERMPSLR